MKRLTLAELEQWRREQKPFQLIDVREPEEHAAFDIGGTLIPLAQVPYALDQFSTEMPVVIYCKRGIRSQIAIQRIAARCPDVDFYNLEGGIGLG